MITKMTDRAWRWNQYGDFLLSYAGLRFFIVFGICVFPCRGLVAILLRLCWLFDGDLRLIRKTVGSIGHDTLAFFQTIHDLKLVVLTYSRLDCLLVSVLVIADHHHGCSAIGSSEDCGSGHHQGFGNNF